MVSKSKGALLKKLWSRVVVLALTMEIPIDSSWLPGFFLVSSVCNGWLKDGSLIASQVRAGRGYRTDSTLVKGTSSLHVNESSQQRLDLAEWFGKGILLEIEVPVHK